jgi:serralysin
MASLLYGCSCALCGGKTLFGDDVLAAGTPFLAAPPPEPVVQYPYTGDYRIDSLLLGTDQVLSSVPMGPTALQYRWNKDAPLGAPVTVTFSFMTLRPFYGGTDTGQGDVGFVPFNEAEKAAVRQIMGILQTQLGIHIVEVPDSTFSYGQIRLGNNFQQVSAGYTWLPFSTGDDRGGDVWIDQRVAGNVGSIAPGSFAWATLVHEIGHALGLKHPGNYNAGTTPLEAGNWLGAVEDNTNYTIMSYRDAAGGQQRDWYGMYDLLTLKALYGSGAPQAGDSVYRYDNSAGRVLGIIDDAGGFDTIDLSALTWQAVVDMRPGAFSSVGINGIAGAVNNLSISLSTLIEKVIGTAFNDAVLGNFAANQFFLGGGTNVADGAAGIDMALYLGPRAAFQVAVSGAAVHVNGPGLSDSLVNVERLAFSDRKVAADIGGAAGITAKILGAVFGRESVIQHPDYAGVGLELLDAGMSYEELMLVALNANGVGPGASHSAIVQLLYTNVVGFAPGPQDLALYQGWLDSGAVTKAQLGVYAAEAPQNLMNIDWVGLSANGIDYV